jgi:hypothetical protein
MVDPNWDPTMPMTINLQRIAPNPASGLNLDLVQNSGNGRFLLTNNAGSPQLKGTFVDYGTNPATLPLTITFRLRRRLDITRSAPTGAPSSAAEEADNPWVEVDQFTVQLLDSNLDSTMDSVPSATPIPQILSLTLRDPLDPGLGGNPAGNDIQPKLMKLRSAERRQPMVRAANQINLFPASLTANSIGQINTASGGLGVADHIWQPHFDRDFTSIMEWLSVPMCGPTLLLDKLSVAIPNLRLVTEQITPNLTNPTFYEAHVAQSKFFRPDFPNNVASTGAPTFDKTVVAVRGNQSIGMTTTATFPSFIDYASYDVNADGVVDNSDQMLLDNRWYRILELLEFPTRANRQLEVTVENNPLAVPASIEGAYQTRMLRVPGRINLNGIRHPEVLMALLDDPNQFNLYTMQDVNETVRDWWVQMVETRDGRDPYTNLVLPGSPASRPFRDYSQVSGPIHVNSGNNVIPGLERSLLRRLPYDNEDTNDNTSIDPGEDSNGDGIFTPNMNGTRRLLEARTATDLTNNYVDPHTRNRLLAKVSNNTTNRSNVFIVWMSVGYFGAYMPNPAAPEVLQIGGELNPANRRRGFFVIDRSLLEDAYNSQTGTFDFKKFIQYRKTIQ